MSYRVTTTFKDYSDAINAYVGAVQGSVIKAGKGPNIPSFFEKGSIQKVLNTFGYPSSTYPGIQDAIDAIQQSGIWLASPTGANAKYGGVLVTTAGTVALTKGLTSKSVTFSAIPWQGAVGTGDGSTTVFSVTLPDYADYVNQSIDIEVGGVSIEVTATDAEPEVLSGTGLTSGSYTRATGALELTFSSAPTTGDAIVATYTVDKSDIAYMALLDAYPQTDDLKVKLTMQTKLEDVSGVETAVDTGIWSMNIYRLDLEGVYTEIQNSPIQISATTNKKNDAGQNVYATTVLDESLLFYPVVNTALTYSISTDDSTPVLLVGGSRGDAVSGSDFATIYTTYFSDGGQYPVNIFFDSTGESEVATAFETLRGTYQTRARYLLPVANQSATSTLADVTSARNSVKDRGIYYYALTWGTHRDLYQGQNFVCSNMGLVAQKHVSSINYNYGAGSVMWLDDVNGVGGQLGSGIVKLSYNATETQLQAFDQAHINPVVMDPLYGPTIKSQRTTYQGTGDYTYIPHSSLADSIISLIETQVIPPQIGKPNDAIHRQRVWAQTNALMQIVDPYLSEWVVLCSSDNNPDSILTARKFVLTIGVKYTPTSEFIDLIFVNGPQGLSITEVVNKTI